MNDLRLQAKSNLKVTCSPPKSASLNYKIKTKISFLSTEISVLWQGIKLSSNKKNPYNFRGFRGNAPTITACPSFSQETQTRVLNLLRTLTQTLKMKIRQQLVEPKLQYETLKIHPMRFFSWKRL